MKLNTDWRRIGDSSEGDQGFSVKPITSFAIPIRSRSAATLAK
jgi:hypothetical protein